MGKRGVRSGTAVGEKRRQAGPILSITPLDRVDGRECARTPITSDGQPTDLPSFFEPRVSIIPA